MLGPCLISSFSWKWNLHVKDKAIMLTGENIEEFSMSVICRWGNLWKLKGINHKGENWWIQVHPKETWFDEERHRQNYPIDEKVGEHVWKFEGRKTQQESPIRRSMGKDHKIKFTGEPADEVQSKGRTAKRTQDTESITDSTQHRYQAGKKDMKWDLWDNSMSVNFSNAQTQNTCFPQCTYM